MKKNLLVILILLSFSSIAQEIDQTRNFVLLSSGKLVYSNKLELKAPIFKKNYIQTSKNKFMMNQVRFYNKDNTLFVNTHWSHNPTGSRFFAERIEKGKINVFELVTVNNSAPTFGPNGMMTGGGFGTETVRYYYNSGFKRTKKLNYANLSKEFKDDPLMLQELAPIKKSRNTRTIIYIVGGAAIAGGIASILIKREERLPAPEIAVIIGGGITFWVAHFMSKSESKKAVSAIQTYNLKHK